MIYVYYIDGLTQERRNSIANALELRLSCANTSIYPLQATQYDRIDYKNELVFLCEFSRLLHWK